MSHFTVLFDACVLFPAQLRSLLMHLALMDLFRARWSDDIHEEWMRGVLEKYPDRTRADVEKVRDKMNAHVRDCLVTNYEDLIPTLQLPDPDDRHVLAAAIRAGASVIVTNNGVPAVALSRVRPIVRHHPGVPKSLSVSCKVHQEF